MQTKTAKKKVVASPKKVAIKSKKVKESTAPKKRGRQENIFWSYLTPEDWKNYSDSEILHGLSSIQCYTSALTIINKRGRMGIAYEGGGRSLNPANVTKLGESLAKAQAGE